MVNAFCVLCLFFCLADFCPLVVEVSSLYILAAGPVGLLIKVNQCLIFQTHTQKHEQIHSVPAHTDKQSHTRLRLVSLRKVQKPLRLNIK